MTYDPTRRMYDTEDTNLPRPSLLEALREPRRPQLGDKCVREIFIRWKKRGSPVAFADLKEVAAIVAPDVTLNECRIAKIVAAAQAVGVKVDCSEFAPKPWRDSHGYLRTDRVLPGGMRWSDDWGWYHVKICIGASFDFAYYEKANPDGHRRYNESLPARA